MDRLLIIEDEEGIRETLKDILELSGYEVFTSKNGKEGFEDIIKYSPDLILCDVTMPELNGFELLSAVNQRFMQIGEVVPPFLFLTAKIEKQDIRQGMNLGADDYILKPFNSTDVLDIIRMRLDKRNALLQIKEEAEQKSTFKKLALPCEDGLELVFFKDIISCQADRTYCKFNLKGGKTILVSKPMKEFEEVLLKNDFLKVHKSYIVNINYAEKYLKGKGGQLLMSDGSVVFVSVRKKDELLKVLKHKHA